MEILCVCDEHFVPHTATMLCSLLEHNSVSRIHLFHSLSARRELSKLKTFVERYGSAITCHQITANYLRDFGTSQATYYRLAAPCILAPDIKKILYLDSDIIVRRSLAVLWDTDVTGYALAAVEDDGWANATGKYAGLLPPFVEPPPGSRYFNAGVMVINLDYWRQNDVYKNVATFMRQNPDKLNYYDQDALNAILADRWISLPAIWNAHDGWAVPDPAIVHFAGDLKPWHWTTFEYPFKDEYHLYRQKTPWRRYSLEGRPPSLLHRSLRSFAHAATLGGLRRWLRRRAGISF